MCKEKPVVIVVEKGNKGNIEMEITFVVPQWGNLGAPAAK